MLPCACCSFCSSPPAVSPPRGSRPAPASASCCSRSTGRSGLRHVGARSHARLLDESSVLWFYRRTAGLIGEERMREQLAKVRFGSDTFERELTWTNGDLVVSPEEQLDFLRRMFGGEHHQRSRDACVPAGVAGRDAAGEDRQYSRGRGAGELARRPRRVAGEGVRVRREEAGGGGVADDGRRRGGAARAQYDLSGPRRPVVPLRASSLRRGSRRSSPRSWRRSLSASPTPPPCTRPTLR